MGSSMPFGPNSSPRMMQIVRIGAIIFKNVVFVSGIISLIYIDVAFSGHFFAATFAGVSHQEALEYGNGLSLATSAIDISFWSFGLYKGFKGSDDLGRKIAVVAALIVQAIDTACAVGGFTHLVYPTTPAINFLPAHPAPAFGIVAFLIAVIVFASTPITALLIDHGIKDMSGHND